MAPRDSGGVGVGTRHSAFETVAVDDGNFNYNERVYVETSQKGFTDFWIRPIGGIVNQEGPFTFNIDPQVDRYLQLNMAALEVVCRVVKEDGTDISLWEDVVAPVNLLGAVMWETVEVALNGHPLPGAAALNSGYKAFLETMLSYDADSFNTHLNSQFFHLDTPGQYGNMKLPPETIKASLRASAEAGKETDYKVSERLRPGPARAAPQNIDEMESTDDSSDDDGSSEGDVSMASTSRRLTEKEKARARADLFDKFYANTMQGTIHKLKSRKFNKGFDARFKVVSGSHQFDMFSPVTHDFFRMNNHIGPGNRVELRLSMHPHSFLLNSYLGHYAWGQYKLRIDDMKLHLRTIERRERIQPPLREVYLMNETQMRKQLVPAGVPSASFRIHNGGVLPKTILLAMVDTKAAEGRYDYNPFNLHHFLASNTYLTINGEQYPSNGLRSDFGKPNCLVSRMYRWLFENTGAAAAGKGNCVSWPAFQAGCFIVAFDLTPDKCNGLHHHNAEYGCIELTIHFDTPLHSSIYVLHEQVFPKVLVNCKVSNTMAVLDIEA